MVTPGKGERPAAGGGDEMETTPRGHRKQPAKDGAISNYAGDEGAQDVAPDAQPAVGQPGLIELVLAALGVTVTV